MPRRPKYDYSDLPGLFDDLDLPPVPAIKPRGNMPDQHQAEGDVYFMSFGSGSSGNCAYIGDSQGGLLIDAGVNIDTVKERLLHAGIDVSMIKGIILTHDHGDHIRFVYTALRKIKGIKVYCTPLTLSGLLRRHSISRSIKDYHQPIFKEFPFKIGNFEITPFGVSHDGTDNVGFYIKRGDLTFAIATDLGIVTERVDWYMRQARHIMLEANYDSAMLANGPYTPRLKARIVAVNGHLDNADAARFLAGIYTPELKHVFLCHLSLDNNRPEIARSTVLREIQAAHPSITIGDASGDVASRDADLQLMCLPRFDASPLFRFR